MGKESFGVDTVVRWLMPKEEHFYGYLEKQAQVAHDASLELAKFKNAGTKADDVRKRVQDIEHDGDAIVHDMEEALARTFVTPIDREDLQRLSKELDDILDLTNGAVRGCVLFGVERPTEPMAKLIDILQECTSIINEAVPLLRKQQYHELVEKGRLLRKLEKDGDAVYRDAISSLFRDDSVDAKKLIREREVLNDLENAIDYCDHVASTLSNLAVKNG